MESFTKEFEHLVVKLEDIKSATNNFDEKQVIGRGGFGKVYKGELSHIKGRSMVAFKRLDRKFGQGDPEFWREIMMLSRYTHENLISLLGYCNEAGEMILVYEYASNGSLDRHLSSTTLTWTQRIKICLDAARGLSYLHDDKGTQQRVIHRDIKSSNILLDENWDAKVSDMGLSKIGPANQMHTTVFTNVVGTGGYVDPMYLQGILTKESDVYSFGVVLFEVMCGRLCFEYSNGESQLLVPMWKKSYEENKLDKIIFRDLKQQMGSCSLDSFSYIAYECLKMSRKERPSMADVVEKLEIALKYEEPIDLIPKEYQEIVKAVVPPLIYRSVEELKVVISKGVLLNGGKTWLSITEKGDCIERIYIEACEIEDDSLEHTSGDIGNCCVNSSSSRFPGGIFYKYYYKFKARVRGQYLTPKISYTLNLVFRYISEWEGNAYNRLRYKLNGEDETRVFIIYPSYMREDGWFIAPLYQFTSQDKTVDFQFVFEDRAITLLVAGIEFQPLEEKAKLRNPVFEEYQDIVKAASQSLVYESLVELKDILSKGVHLDGYKRWFSLNEKGEHCELISMEDCLIPNEDFTPQYVSHYKSTFRAGLYQTNNKGFKTHVKTQFLSPSITYTVNLVFYASSYGDQAYVGLKYRLSGEPTTSTAYLANQRREDLLYTAELYQFTSDGSIVDLEIMFDDCGTNIRVDGILFHPLEIVEEDPCMLEDTQTILDSGILNLSSETEKWTMKKYLYSSLGKLFQFNNDTAQEWSYLNIYGKKSLMLSARASCLRMGSQSTWCFLPESRFGEVLVITTGDKIELVNEIKPEVLSANKRYADYFVYKVPSDQSKFEFPLEVSNKWGKHMYSYLVSPPKTPVIGQKFDENNYNQLNRHKLSALPRQRADGWMEVKVWEFQTRMTPETISMNLKLEHPAKKDLGGLTIQGIDIRPYRFSFSNDGGIARIEYM